MFRTLQFPLGAPGVLAWWWDLRGNVYILYLPCSRHYCLALGIPFSNMDFNCTRLVTTCYNLNFKPEISFFSPQKSCSYSILLVGNDKPLCSGIAAVPALKMKFRYTVQRYDILSNISNIFQIFVSVQCLFFYIMVFFISTLSVAQTFVKFHTEAALNICLKRVLMINLWLWTIWPPMVTLCRCHFLVLSTKPNGLGIPWCLKVH